MVKESLGTLGLADESLAGYFVSDMC